VLVVVCAQRVTVTLLVHMVCRAMNILASVTVVQRLKDSRATAANQTSTIIPSVKVTLLTCRSRSNRQTAVIER